MLALLKNQIVWKYLSMTKLKFIVLTALLVTCPSFAQDNWTFEAELKALENQEYQEEEKSLARVEALNNDEDNVHVDEVSYVQSSALRHDGEIKTDEFLPTDKAVKIRRVRSR